MIQIPNVELTPLALAKLATWQAYVDAAKDYSVSVERAKAQFAIANTRLNVTFREVRNALTSMCNGAKRCMYCEDSAADEVEHHKPKDLFPEHCFVWDNYLYACGPCNGPKKNKFSVISDKGLLDITRPRGVAVEPPQKGEPALIHPKFEDPMSFMFLDILGQTFRFTPHPQASPLEFMRAEYTIQTLGLNSKDFLLVARREAYDTYMARLRQYVQTKTDPGIQPPLVRQFNSLRSMQHPTVLREMLRQASFLSDVQALLVKAPELALL